MKTIFDKTTLKNMELKNRIFRSATWMAMADYNGYVTDRIIDLYRSYAEGGIGAIITGITTVVPDDLKLDGIIVFTDDSYIEGHKRLTDAVHEAGSKIFLQTAMVSSVKTDEKGNPYRVEIDDWTTEEVKNIISYFGNSALRAKKAGYDGVQIHAAHFFFLSSFISPLYNHRTDEYGGSPEKRAKILVDVLKDMRKKAGEDFPIIVKINATDVMAGGVEEKDFLIASMMLADEGIDAIEVSANQTSHPRIKAGVNEAYFKDYAVSLKELCPDVPVILVGGHRSIESMNEVLNSTNIEYLSLSRPFIREPYLMQRWENGDTSPSKCVSCNSCYRTPNHECIFNLKRGGI